MAECGAGCGARAGSGAYALQLSDGTRVVADAVVLATPAWASGDLLRPVAPLAAADLSSIEYVTTATASVAFRADQVGHDLKGFGFVVPRAENRPVMATTWSSSKFDGRAPDGHVLLRSFLGRAGREAAAQLDDDEMAAVVRAELREIMGITAEPEFVRIFRWPRGMPQYRVGHVELVAHIEAAVARVPGIELAGGAYHGIGIGDCLREGAAAAERALEHVRGLPEDDDPAAAAGPPRRRRPGGLAAAGGPHVRARRRTPCRPRSTPGFAHRPAPIRARTSTSASRCLTCRARRRAPVRRAACAPPISDRRIGHRGRPTLGRREAVRSGRVPPRRAVHQPVSSHAADRRNPSVEEASWIRGFSTRRSGSSSGWSACGWCGGWSTART